jgi:hypothetical protein
MPGSGGSAAVPYRVVYPEVVRQDLMRLGETARQLGFSGEFASAVKTVDARLRLAPLEFGEALYTLRHLGLEMRAAAVFLLGVRYAVDEARRIVYVLEVNLLGRGA